MDRRFVGIGLLVVALLAAAILPGLLGRRLTGTAAVEHGVPVVGGCVWAPNGVMPTAMDSSRGTIRVAAGRAEDCTVPGAARVLGVTYGTYVPNGSWIATDSALTPWCDAKESSTEKLSGASSYIWKGPSGFIAFQPIVGLQGALVLASPGSGRWLACVAADTAGQPLALDLNLNRPDSWGQLTGCLDPASLRVVVNHDQNTVTDAASLVTPCSVPHVAQVLGEEGQRGGSLTQTDHRTACAAYAKASTGMTDPTAGGQLVVRTVNTADQGTWSGSCLLVVADTTKTLTGSLYGIGNAPLPWTN